MHSFRTWLERRFEVIPPETLMFNSADPTVFINPTLDEMMKCARSNGGLRGLIDASDNSVYIWQHDAAFHYDVAAMLGIKYVNNTAYFYGNFDPISKKMHFWPAECSNRVCISRSKLDQMLKANPNIQRMTGAYSPYLDQPQVPQVA